MRQKHTTVQMFCEKHLENISDMFRTLYRDEELADVTLYCRGGSVKAHKLILAASSPYFQKIFLENKSENLIIFLHGIGLEELKNLVDLMYRGAADIPVDNVDMMYNYVNELQLTGVLQDESRVPNGETPSRRNSRNRDRDARFRGFKRVAANYSDTNEHYTRSSERLSSSDAGTAPQADTSTTENLETEEAEVPITHDEDLVVAKKLERAMQKSNLWSKKPRKYKCELCDRSFKRASHLTRHQLVHTAHEDIDLYNTIAPEWTGHLQTVDAPRHKLPPPPSQSSGLGEQIINEAINSEEGSQQPLMDTMYEVPEPPPGEGGECPPPVKKARGRPRKYPKVPPPLIKRGRGRPRIRPIQPKPDQLAADSFMDSNPPAQLKMEQYDFSNLPFGDIEYLTRPLRNKGEITKLKEGAGAPDERSLHHEVVLEPVVEIKTEPEDRPPTPENISPIVENEIEPPTLEKSPEASALPPPTPPTLPPETTLTRVVLPSSSAESQPTTSKASTFEKKVVETTSKLTMFENQIAKIGECTISVANV